MAYILPSDIRKSMKKLPQSITDEELEDVISKATAYVNGMLGRVYVVPFEETTLPPLIKFLTLDLAIFFMYENLYSSQQPNLDEYQEKRWDRIVKMIEDILSGELGIDAPMLPPSEQTSAGFATTNDTIGIFSLDDPFW